MKLSLIIPVLNEAHNIRGCLRSVAAQTLMPDEVIVVDNNCTDDTVKIAKEFPFVRVITETRQGRGYARTAGFEAAHGELLGRIDADSRLSPDWVERVVAHFDRDPALSGLTGYGKTSFLPFVERLKTTMFSKAFLHYMQMGYGTRTMWGATMAVRASAWRAAAPNVCLDDEAVHEDSDLSVVVAAAGGSIIEAPDVLISTTGEAYMSFRKLLRYKKLFQTTRQRHQQNGNLARVPKHPLNFGSRLSCLFLIYILGSIILVVHAICRPFVSLRRLFSKKTV